MNISAATEVLKKWEALCYHNDDGTDEDSHELLQALKPVIKFLEAKNAKLRSASEEKPLKQPCQVCRDHKPNAPFKIRDDNGILFKTSFISNCPYCGRYLFENYRQEEKR